MLIRQIYKEYESMNQYSIRPLDFVRDGFKQHPEFLLTSRLNGWGADQYNKYTPFKLELIC